MKKYWKILTTDFQNSLTYRVNFVMWRIRQVIIFLVPYFIWTSVLHSGDSLYGYELNQLLTYTFGTILLRSLVFSSRTIDLAGIINSGDLTLYLLKPISIFKYWFARDISDKLMNLSFIFIEFPLLILILRPPLSLQANLLFVAQAILATAIAVIMYFYLNFLFGMIGFWSREVWAPRFLLLVILQFASGGIFPLDMLPKVAQNVLNLTPFPYMLFFPLKTYLGGTSTYYLQGIFISILWTISLKYLAEFVWQKGLKQYEAEGR